MEADDTRILCVIIHFRDADLTWNCVQSILSNNTNVDVVIVDNDPKQDFEIIYKYRPHVTLHRTGGNLGFAAANNAGVRVGKKANHSMVLLLNNDTIVLANAITQMVTVLNSENVGAVGPCMPYLDYPKEIWACGGFIDKMKVKIGAIQKPLLSGPFEVGYLPGAAILCWLHLWEKVGGLPEKYFLGYEEAELALRLQKLSYRIMVNPQAVIFHKVGMSSQRIAKYDYNDIRNRIKFGCYLWGKLLGTCWVIFLTFRSMLINRSSFALWMSAVIDELSGSPLDGALLSKIQSKYGRN